MLGKPGLLGETGVVRETGVVSRNRDSLEKPGLLGITCEWCTEYKFHYICLENYLNLHNDMKLFVGREHHAHKTHKN